MWTKILSILRAKTVLATGLLLSLLSTLAVAQTIPTYISSMSDYQVRALTGTYAPTNGKGTILSVTPADWLTGDSTGGTWGVIAAWSGGPYAISGTKLFVHGGGHGDSANNGMYVFDFSGTTAPTGWMLPAISNYSDVNGSGSAYNDGKPVSVHPYNGQVYATHNNTVYRFGGSPYPMGQFTAASWKFNVATNTWTQLTAYPYGAGAYNAMYNPATGKILVSKEGGFGGAFLNTSTETWSAQEATGSVFGSEGCSAWDPKRGRGVQVGGGQSKVLTIDWSAETISVATLSASGDTTMLNQKGGCVYDQARDVYWLFGGTDGSAGWSNIYEMNASTFAITAHSLSATISTTFQQGSYGRFVFLSNWRAIGIVGGYNTPVYVIKLPPASTLPLGALVHDGPPTPEQLALYLPVTGTLTSTATATVRYKPTGSSAWITGHPLYRIRPDLAERPDTGTVPDAFAWPIIDLTPGTSYDVEVTVNDGTTVDIRTNSFTTRALPPAAGAPNKTITAGSSSATIQTAFNNLNPGDVLQFQNGTYNVDNLIIDRSGTLNNPIYIRGQSRNGVVLSDPNGRIFYMLNASHIIIENMTLEGSGVDPGLGSQSVGIEFYGGSPTQTNVTIRNVTMTGVDVAVTEQHEVQGLMIYDNTFTGNNTWTMDHYAYGGSGTWAPDGVPDIAQNLTWNDDGIAMTGSGNVAFNNTLTGFGDTLTFSPGGNHGFIVGNHFYRNEIRNGGDDGIEADYSHRNNTLYDNRFTNTMTFVSLDPLYGGPFLAARNISINQGRSWFKWNSQNSGQFIYNNTIIGTVNEYEITGSCPQCGAWYQANNGNQAPLGLRNNLFVYRSPTANHTVWISNLGYNPIDWDHNSWYPSSLGFTFRDNNYANLAALQAGADGTATITPVFSGYTHRFTADNGTVSNPWTTTVTLGANYRTEVTTKYLPALSNGDAAKNSGVVIPNITDGYSGAAPDRGAIIEGRLVPLYGDRDPTLANPSGGTVRVLGR